MCNHPQISWVGTADGIRCGLCGALVDPAAPAPSGSVPKQPKIGRPAAEKAEPDPEPVEEKTKKAPKKGGRK